MSRKLIALRYAGACATCATQLRVGDRAWHDRSQRTVTCQPCAAGAVFSGPSHAATGVAGSSAEAEGARRRRARIERRRQQFGTLGAALAWLNDPQHERAWRVGAAGERKTAERLARHLRDKGVVVLHDRRMPGSRANIDHIAVGPGGITVIDSKALKGKVRAVRRGGLLSERTEVLSVGGRDRTELIDGLEHQVAAVASVVDEIGRAELEIRGCLCLVDPDGLPLLDTVRVRGVLVLGARGAAKLATCPGALAAHEVSELVDRLGEAFAPA